MDLADQTELMWILSTHGVLVGQHASTLCQVLETLQEFSASISALGWTRWLRNSSNSPLPPPPARPAALPLISSHLPHKPNIHTDYRYSRDLRTCAEFLNQCNLVFIQEPLAYSADQSCVCVMSLCIEKAVAWSLAISLNNPALCLDYSAFTDIHCLLTIQLKTKKPLVSFYLLSKGVQFHNMPFILAYWQWALLGMRAHFRGVS